MADPAEQLPPADTSECHDHGRVGDRDGYHNTRGLVAGKLTRYRLHRLIYCQAHNLKLEDIKGQLVRHICDNPRCINPEHLQIGTYQDNSRDMVERGRSLVGSRHPKSKLTEEQVADVRRRYVRGHKSHNQGNAHLLAAEFGVSREMITRICRGDSWGHCGNTALIQTNMTQRDMDHAEDC